MHIYTHTHAHTHTYASCTRARTQLPSSFLKFDRIRNGARYLPTRISRAASLFGRIYCPWIIGSPRRMIGYTKFDSPRRLFFSISLCLSRSSSLDTFAVACERVKERVRKVVALFHSRDANAHGGHGVVISITTYVCPARRISHGSTR